MVRRSCVGGRVWLSFLWQQKLLVGSTVLGRGRSRSLSLRLPGTRDRRRVRLSTISGVVWQFCSAAGQCSKRSEFFQIFFKFSRLLLIFQTISKLSEFFVRSKSALFRLVVRKGFAHFVRKVFACRKLLPGKFWVFAALPPRS